MEIPLTTFYCGLGAFSLKRCKDIAVGLEVNHLIQTAHKEINVGGNRYKHELRICKPDQVRKF